MDNEIKEMFGLILSRLDNLEEQIQDVRTELKTEIQDVRTEIQDVRTELKTEIQDVRTDVIDIKTEIAKTTTKYIEAIYGGYKMNVDKFDSVDFNAIKHNTDVALSVSLSNSKITEELAARVAELEKKVG